MTDQSKEQNQNNKKLNFKQKAGVVGLIILTIFVVSAWMLNLNQSIRNPVSGDQDNNNNSIESGSTCSGGDCGTADTTKDSDGDGLSDWEEVNTYNTSPYLEDTDSDGINDKEEIEQGSDPNCPQGEDCGNSGSFSNNDAEGGSGGSGGYSGSSTSTADSSLSQNFSPDLNLDATTSKELNDSGEFNEVMQGSGDPEALREMLLQAGMDENMLNQVSDEQLMQSYQEVLNKNK